MRCVKYPFRSIENPPHPTLSIASCSRKERSALLHEFVRQLQSDKGQAITRFAIAFHSPLSKVSYLVILRRALFMLSSCALIKDRQKGLTLVNLFSFELNSA